MATLKDLLADCYRGLNYGPTPPADATTRLTGFINDTQEELLSEPGNRRLLAGSHQFQTIAGRHLHGLPAGAARILAVIDVANQTRLREMSLDQYRTYLPTPKDTLGTPTAYAMDRWRAIQDQPAHATRLFLSRTYGGPAIDLKVRMTFEDGDQEYGGGTIATKEATVSMPAAPGVYVPLPFGRVLEILDFTIDRPLVDPPAYDVLLLHIEPEFNPGDPPIVGGPISYITAPNTSQMFTIFHLIPTPSVGGMPIRCDFEYGVRPLVSPQDTSVLLPKFHRLLADGARLKEYELRGDLLRFRICQTEYERDKAFMRSLLTNDPDDVPFPSDHRERGPNPLGGWYPYDPYRLW